MTSKDKRLLYVYNRLQDAGPEVCHHSYHEKENTATPFAADSSHVAHWIPKFFLVVAWLGKLLKAEAAHFRVESATQNWDIVSIGCRAWKKVHSLWSSWKEELHSTVDPSQVDSTARLATSPDSFSSPWGNKIPWVAHPTETMCAAVLSWSC